MDIANTSSGIQEPLLQTSRRQEPNLKHILEESIDKSTGLAYDIGDRICSQADEDHYLHAKAFYKYDDRKTCEFPKNSGEAIFAKDSLTKTFLRDNQKTHLILDSEQKHILGVLMPKNDGSPLVRDYEIWLDNNLSVADFISQNMLGKRDHRTVSVITGKAQTTFNEKPGTGLTNKTITTKDNEGVTLITLSKDGRTSYIKTKSTTPSSPTLPSIGSMSSVVSRLFGLGSSSNG